jgi:pimeloyl-ACP methyl ester carboxylesterase
MSLLHRMVVTGEGQAIHLERYFYVGHSFNSMQALTWALAHEDGTMVFLTTRVSTDEVLGMGSQLKRSVARGQVRDEMRARLERLRSAFAGRPMVTESP